MYNSGFALNIFEISQPCLGSGVQEDATIGLRSPLIKALKLSVEKVSRKGRESNCCLLYPNRCLKPSHPELTNVKF